MNGGAGRVSGGWDGVVGRWVKGWQGVWVGDSWTPRLTPVPPRPTGANTARIAETGPTNAAPQSRIYYQIYFLNQKKMF